MRLKILTTSAFACGVLIVAFWPWIYRQRPGLSTHNAPLTELREFQVMFAGYIGSAMFAFMTSGCLAMLLMRQAKEEYSTLVTDNVRELVEGSLEDLRGKGKSQK